jgi:hypothetical protein
MFDRNAPVYAPLLLPSDEQALATCGPLQAAILSATTAVSDRLASFRQVARERAAKLIVDPRTAVFQFEGYMSMEDMRALPYSPDRTAPGTLWQAHQFSRGRRREVIQAVAAVQVHLGVDAIVAPYFLVPDPSHDWLEVAVDVARETRAQAGDRPVAVNVCVDIDTILAEGARASYGDAFCETGADLFFLTVVNLDEREATPNEVRAVLDLLARLSRAAPSMLLYAGRLGLSAIAAGAVGYAGGTLELEAHPRSYLREGFVNLRANAHYLPGAMVRLPVRQATAVAACVPATDILNTPPATRLVQRERVRRALDAKTAETRWLAGYSESERESALVSRLAGALALCQEAQSGLERGDGEKLARSAFHYLEVLREVAGGEKAELLGSASF